MFYKLFLHALQLQTNLPSIENCMTVTHQDGLKLQSSCMALQTQAILAIILRGCRNVPLETRKIFSMQFNPAQVDKEWPLELEGVQLLETQVPP